MSKSEFTVPDGALPEIKRLHALGWSAREIGIELGMGTRVVSRIMLVNRLKQGKNATQGLSPTEEEALRSKAAKGAHPTEIAKELRLTPETVRRHLNNWGIEYPDKRDQNRILKQQLLGRIVEMSLRGVPHREIRRELGVSESVYQAYQRELGLGRGVTVKIDDAEVRKLHKKGSSESQIAETLGVSRRRVRSSLLKTKTRSSKEPLHGIVGGFWMQRECECTLCTKARAIIRQEARSKNEATQEMASNKGKEWTGPELEIVARNDLTAKEKAAMLKRTLYSVQAAVHRAQHDPAWIEGFGVRVQERKQYRASPKDIDLMLDRSLKVTEVAERLGCSESLVQAYRSGKLKGGR